MISLRGGAWPRCAASRGRFSWHFFLLGAGFMLLETKSIIQFALLWGSTWIVASLSIAAVLTMALVANFIVARMDDRAAVAGGRRPGGAAGGQLRGSDRPDYASRAA